MDWDTVISDIKKSGYTQEQIAEAIGVSAGTISELRSGKVNDPRWSSGDALLKLHAECCKAAA
jgi:transcriptional regulator with XRE-family HTH domain